MGTRQHKTKGWVIFAVFCAVLFCVAALRACATKSRARGMFAGTGKARADGLLPAGYDGMAGLRRLRLAHRPHHRRRGVPSRHGPCMFGRYAGAGRDGWRRICRPAEHDLRQLSPPEPQRRAGDALRPPPIPLRSGRRGGAGRSAAGDSGGDGRSTGAHLHFELLEQGVRYDAGALLGLP